MIHELIDVFGIGVKPLEGFNDNETNMINKYKAFKMTETKAITKQVDRETRQHREISPSRLKRITSCYGSYALTKRFASSGEKQEPSEAAKDGNKTGAMLEAFLNARFDERFNVIHEQRSVPELKDCEPDRLDRIKQVYGYLTEWRKEILEVYPNAEFFYFRQEEFYECWDIEGIEGVGGSSDISIAWRVKDQVNLAIMDLKDGQIFVDSKSPQLVAYAAGLMKTLVQKGLAMYSSFNFIHLHILQPKINNFSARVVPYSELIQEIKDLKSKTQLAVALHKDGNEQDVISYLSPEPENCRCCPVKTMCPALKKEVDNVFDVITVEDAPKSVPEIVQGMTTEQKVNVIKYRKLIEDLISEIRTDFVKQISKGVKINGLKLVASKADQDMWNQALSYEERKKLIEEAGGKAEEVVELTPAKVKKQLGKKFETLNLTEKRSFGLTVVHEGERGKEIDIDKINAIDVFSEI